jgi:6-phosphogluconolactonase (cycloisomerase 2 family)
MTLVIVNAKVLPPGVVGGQYGFTFEATGGVRPYAWHVARGQTMPTGLGLDPDTGRVSGVPTEALWETVAIRVQDSSQPKVQFAGAYATFLVRRPPFLYVTTDNAGIWAFRLVAGGLVQNGQPLACAGQVVTASPDGQSVYVMGRDVVFQFDVRPNGVLVPKSTPTVASGSGPVNLAFTPDGSSAFVPAFFDSTIWQYDVDATTGELSPKASPTIGGALSPNWLTVSPDGKSAYVASSPVTQYDIAPGTGQLSQKNPFTVATVGSPTVFAVVAPNGRSVYVTAWQPYVIAQYHVDSATGALSPMAPPTMSVPYGPFGIAITPDGGSLYVASFHDSQWQNGVVWQFDIQGGTGQLSPKIPATVSTCLRAANVVVSPDGLNAFVTPILQSGITQYDVSPSGGQLAPKSTPSVPTGAARIWFPGMVGPAQG